MSTKEPSNEEAQSRLLPLMAVLSAVILIPASFVDVVDSSGGHLFNYFSLVVLLAFTVALSLRLKSSGWRGVLAVFALILTTMGSLLLFVDVVLIIVG